jgi:hypothetical protein
MVVFLGIFMPGCFSIDSVTKYPTETQGFPNGEVLTCESSRFQGFQGGNWNNQLYFQETASSPREKIGNNIFYAGTFPQHPVSQARLIYQNGLILAMILNERIFRHCLSHGKWFWEEFIPRRNSNATLGFLRSFLKADYPDLTHFTGPIYYFDHFDIEHNLLITKRSSPENQFPLFLIYSTVTYDEPDRTPPGMLNGADLDFDLERTRSENGFKPPESTHLILDVEVTTAGKKLLTESVSLSSTAWKSFNYPTADAVGGQTGQITIGGEGGQAVELSKHVEALFGFQDAVPDYFTICWRGKDYYGIQYRTVRLGAWDTVFSSGAVPNEDILFRVRKAE